jgi:hypothetical protein
MWCCSISRSDSGLLSGGRAERVKHAIARHHIRAAEIGGTTTSRRRRGLVVVNRTSNRVDVIPDKTYLQIFQPRFKELAYKSFRLPGGGVDPLQLFELQTFPFATVGFENFAIVPSASAGSIELS